MDTHGRLMSSLGDKFPSEFNNQFEHGVGMKGSLLEEIESSTTASDDMSVNRNEESTDPLLVLKMAEVKYQK